MANNLVYSPISPVYRIPTIPINPEQLVNRAMDRFEQFERDRVNWLTRREDYYLGWDDYLSPIRKGPWDGSSNLHLPMTEIKCMAMHARIMQAFFFIEPWFYVDPQEELDAERIQKVESMMKYIVMRYANNYKGIYLAIDDWAWDLVTDGVGILSRAWKTLQRRFVGIVENQEFLDQKIELENLLSDDVEVKEFERIAKDIMKYPYKEEEVVRPVFNGPIVTAEDPTYILFKGDVVDCTDLNEQETVIQVVYFSRDQLIAFKQSGYMDDNVIDEILARQPDSKGNSVGTTRESRIERIKDAVTGVKTQNPTLQKDEFEFLRVFDRVSLEVNDKLKNKRLADELEYFVHTGSRKLSRWTFLDRISASGKRPLHMAHLYRRPRRSIGRGMVETQHTMNEAADMLVNQAIDTGMLVNQPMFAFRSNSTFDPKEFRVGPGVGVKCEDPNNDFRFFSWNANPNWAAPLMGLVQSFSDQQASLGPVATGQVGPSVGPLRSTSGVNALGSESGINLDVVIKRAKITYSEMLEGLYMDCVSRMPNQLKITVTGPDGEPILSTSGVPVSMELSRKELTARVHFGLFANSQNMNRAAQEAAAMKIAQFLLQPIGIQSKVVQPKNIYEIYRNVIRSMGTQQAWRFISKPDDIVAVPFQAEILMIMQGITPAIALNDPDREKKIETLQGLINSPQAQLEAQYGMVNKNAIDIAKAVLDQHQKMLAATQKPTNIENPTGAQTSPSLGTQSPEGPQNQGEQRPEANNPNQTI